MKRILIIGSASEDKYIGNSLRACKKLNEDIHFDFFATSIKTNCPFSPTVDQMVNKVRHYPSIFYRVPKLRGYCNQQDLLKSLKDFIFECKSNAVHYDSCHIHFLNPVYAKIVEDLKLIANQIIITPWGSDILRTKRSNIPQLRILAHKCDIIATTKLIRFGQDVMRILNVADDRIYNLPFGLAAVDEILKLENGNDNLAKHALNVDNQYTIVIGYNGNPAHHHLSVIKALSVIKNQLPSNYILLFPLTYGGNSEYIQQIKNLLEQEQLNYKFFTEYLSDDQIALLRKATDLFIHAQTSDANSGTIAEYLLCRKKIVNPSWITYPHYEQYGRPFYYFHDFEELPKVILQAIQAKESIVPVQLVEEIKKSSWTVRAKEWVDLYMQS